MNYRAFTVAIAIAFVHSFDITAQILQMVIMKLRFQWHSLLDDLIVSWHYRNHNHGGLAGRHTLLVDAINE